MKNSVKLSALLATVLLLSACGTEEYDEALQKGSAALEKKDFEVAIAQFQKASELNPELTDPKLKEEQAEAAYFDALYEKGKEAMDALAFTEAKELFMKAYELDEVKQPDILELKLKAEELEKKQKQLDNYSKWVTKSIKTNNQLSTEWRNASSNLSIGTMAIPEFKEKMQSMLSTYQELITSAEKEISNISGELTTLHTGYLNKLQENHELVRHVILSTGSAEAKAEELLSKGYGLSDIQAQQALHVQSLHSYAQAQGIQFNEN